MKRTRVLACSAILSVAACSGSDAHDLCVDDFVGDPSAAPDVEIVVRDADGSTRLATDLDPVDLILPPQGGKVILVAPRVRNMDTCAVRVTAVLRDQCTDRIIALETRPLRFGASGDGWASPDNPQLISNWSNVPACPSAAAVRNIDGQPYLLTVIVEDGRGRKATTSRRVVPTCAEPENRDRCLCECNAAYRLGESCPPDVDGGTGDACP